MSYYEVAPCSLGYVIRPAEALDNRRWYFEREADAHEQAEYLERQDQLDGVTRPAVIPETV